MASAPDRTIANVQQEIRDAEARAAWHHACHQPNAEQEARTLLLTLHYDALLASRAAAARTIWAHRKLGST